jgi:hypothetical protein
MIVAERQFKSTAGVIGYRQAGYGNVITQSEYAAIEFEHSDDSNSIGLQAVFKAVSHAGPGACAQGEFVQVVV